MHGHPGGRLGDESERPQVENSAEALRRRMAELEAQQSPARVRAEPGKYKHLYQGQEPQEGQETR